jgi:Bacterial Ig-like domain
MMRMLIAALCLALASCATEAPQVETTFPAQGAIIAPGAAELRVTFSQPMAGGRWSYVIASEGRFPDMAGSPRLEEDGRTFVADMRLEPSTAYAVQFNSPTHTNFRSAVGAPAETYVLRFSTGAQ